MEIFLKSGRETGIVENGRSRHEIRRSQIQELHQVHTRDEARNHHEFNPSDK